MHIVYYTQEIDKNFEDEFLHNRWTFFNKRVAFIHNFWFPATFISDKFWSDPQLQRSHRGDVFRVLFQFITPSLRRRKLWGRVSPQPLNFFIGSPRLFIIFDFQQLLLMTNFDQTHGYGDRIEAMFLVTLFHRSIDQAILLVTLSIERYFWWHFFIDRLIKRYFWWHFRSSDTFGDIFSLIDWSSDTFGDTFASSPASKNRFRNI